MQIHSVCNTLFRDACPLCHSREVSSVDILDYFERTRFSSLEIELTHKPELWKCNSCGSKFTQYVIPESQAKALYTAGEAGDRWSTVPFVRQKCIEVVKLLERYFVPEATVLDVGANTGELLDFAKLRGCSTIGVEYSEASRGVLSSKGHEVCFSMAALENQVDVICAFDLFEHLYDTSGFLSQCYNCLRHNGKLILLTGDVESLSARLAGPHWWYAQYPEHIIFPTTHFFRELSEFSLLSAVRTYASKGYQRSYLLGVAQLIRRKIQRKNFNGLPSLGPDHILLVLEKNQHRELERCKP